MVYVVRKKGKIIETFECVIGNIINKHTYRQTRKENNNKQNKGEQGIIISVQLRFVHLSIFLMSISAHFRFVPMIEIVRYIGLILHVFH